MILSQREGITALRTYQYLIFHHTVIETHIPSLDVPVITTLQAIASAIQA